MASESSIRIAIDASAAKQGAAQVTSALSTVAGEATKLDRNLNQLDAGVVSTGAAMSGLGAASLQASRALGATQKDIYGLAVASSEANRAIGSIENSLTKVGRAAQASAAQIRTLQSLQNLGGYGGTASLTPSDGGGGAISAEAAAAGGALAGLKGQALAAFGAFAGYQTVVKATSAIADFEKQLKQIAVVGGVDQASNEFKLIEETAREIGTTTQFSAGQAAAGLLELTKAGLDAKDSISAIRPAIDLAVAGDVTLARSSEILLATIAQFGKSASDSRSIADVLVKQANVSQSSVEGLAEGFRVVGPLANAVGSSFERTSAILGVLNDAAIRSAEAGTGLRTVLSALSQPTADTARGVERLGLTLDDINPKTNSLVDIFKKLKAAGLDTQTAFQLFGTYGATAGLVIAENTDKLEKYEAALSDANGTSKAASDAVGNTLTGAFSKLKGSLESIAISLGDAGLTSILTNLADLLKDVATGIDDVAQGASSLANAVGTSSPGTYDPTKGIGGIAFTAPPAPIGLPAGVSREEYIRASFLGRTPQAPGIDFSKLSGQFSSASPFVSYGQSTISDLPQQAPVSYTLDIPFGPEAPQKQEPFVTYGSTGTPFGPEQGALDALREQLDLRKSLVGLSEQQKTIIEQVAEAEKAAVQQYGPGSPEGAAAVAAYRTELEATAQAEARYTEAVKATEDASRKAAEAEAQRIEEVKKRAEGIADAISQPVGAGLNQAFSDLLNGGEFNAKAIGQKIGNDILTGLFNELVTSVLVAAIKKLILALLDTQTGGAASSIGKVVDLSGGGQAYALGGAFSGGRTIPFASGGYITNGPQYFPLAGGNRGLMGEAGPEAIMPLERMPNGKLGVYSGGGGGGNVFINVTTPDADSFRRSEQHILGDVNRRKRRWNQTDRR